MHCHFSTRTSVYACSIRIRFFHIIGLLILLSDESHIEESDDCEEENSVQKENKQPGCSEVPDSVQATRSQNRKVTSMQLQVLQAQLEAANATKEAMVEVKAAATEFHSFLSKFTSNGSEVNDAFSFLKFLEKTTLVRNRIKNSFWTNFVLHLVKNHTVQ